MDLMETFDKSTCVEGIASMLLSPKGHLFQLGTLFLVLDFRALVSYRFR